MDEFLKDKIDNLTLEWTLGILGNSYWYKLWCITKQQRNWERKIICSRKLGINLLNQPVDTRQQITERLWYDFSKNNW